MRDYHAEYDEPSAVDLINDEAKNCLPEYVAYLVWDEDGDILAGIDNGNPGDDPYCEPKRILIRNYEGEGEGDWDVDTEKARAHGCAYFIELEDRYNSLRHDFEYIDQSFRDGELSKPMETWQEHWASVMEFLDPTKLAVNPVGDDEVMYFECQEAGDSVPEWCDNCNTWHATSHCWEYGKDATGLFIKLCQVDQDGDWDYTYIYEGDWEYYGKYMPTTEFFLRWMEYWLWCYEHGAADPLSECRYWKDKQLSLAECLDNAAEELRYLNLERSIINHWSTT